MSVKYLKKITILVLPLKKRELSSFLNGAQCLPIDIASYPKKDVILHDKDSKDWGYTSEF
jgi:hypothetical protein